MKLRSLGELDVEGKRALVRADFNVPLDGGRIVDDSRIRAALPTIEWLIEHGAAVIAMSHLGRPEAEPVPRLSLRPVAERLGELIDRPVRLAPDSVGEETAALAGRLEAGQVLLLENTRFHAGEGRNDRAYARALAALADCYVGDAFGTAHREHASTVGVARELPAAAGLLVEREVAALSRVLEQPAHPWVLVMGGAKVADKLPVIEHLLVHADSVLLGGAIANTFARARGQKTGDSLVDESALDDARRLLDRCGDRVVMPADALVADRADPDAETDVLPFGDVPPGKRILDIGPVTQTQFDELLLAAKTVVWNGPMGLFEIERYAAGTKKLATAVGGLDAYVVVGGGETVAALRAAGAADRVDHVSTGGGAMLAFLRGSALPGLEVLAAR